MSDEEFTEAVQRYSDMLFRIALSCCKNRSDAEDIVQNGNYSVLLRNPQFLHKVEK